MTAVDERLIELLSKANPWWETGAVPGNMSPPYRRRDFFVLREKLKRRPILAISGPRQVGKTTLMYQVISDLLASGVPRERILYVSFDLPGIGLHSDEPLNDAIRVYEERILRQDFRTATETTYIFFDEITKIQNWHRDLKGWFDLAYNICFVVTSSSQTELLAGAAVSLTGRVATHLLLSWKFVDVMCFRTGNRLVSENYLDARDTLKTAFKNRDPEVLFRRLTDLRPATRASRLALRAALERYLLVDGFPELLPINDLAHCAKRLDEYVKLTLANDLYRFHNIRSSTRVLEDLLSLIASQTGGLFSYQNVADALSIESRTVMDYLNLLEGAFLVSTAPFYTRNRVSRQRRQRKIYVTNSGVLNVLRGSVDISVTRDPTQMGHLVESVVHGYAKRMAFNWTLRPNPAVFYWRDRRDREVDVVLEIDGIPLPIEVKYRENPKADLGGLDRFVAEKRPPFSIVVTKDHLELENGRLFVPLEEFLMLA